MSLENRIRWIATAGPQHVREWASTIFLFRVTPPKIHMSRQHTVAGIQLHVLPLLLKIGALFISYALIFREREEERETETLIGCCTNLHSH